MPESYTAAALASRVDGRIAGDPATLVQGFAGVESARRGDISFAAERWRARAASSEASVLVVAEEIPDARATQIVVRDVNLAFALIVSHMSRDDSRRGAGIESGAHVDGDAAIDPTAWIHAGATVAAG